MSISPYILGFCPIPGCAFLPVVFSILCAFNTRKPFSCFVGVLITLTQCRNRIKETLQRAREGEGGQGRAREGKVPVLKEGAAETAGYTTKNG